MFQNESLGLNVLEMYFWNTVTTITAIQTEKAAVYEKMTSFVHKITPYINIFATLGCDQRMQKVKKKNKLCKKRKIKNLQLLLFKNLRQSYSFSPNFLGKRETEWYLPF